MLCKPHKAHSTEASCRKKNQKKYASFRKKLEKKFKLISEGETDLYKEFPGLTRDKKIQYQKLFLTHAP